MVTALISSDLSVLAPESNERQLEVLVDLIGAANLQEENVVLQHPLIGENPVILASKYKSHIFRIPTDLEMG